MMVMAKVLGEAPPPLKFFRMTDMTISEEHHGSADNRRYTYEPTFIMRGLSELHITFTPVG